MLPPATPPDFEVRRAGAEDVERISRLHAARLPHGFFVRLGPRYLRAYHRTFIGNDSAVALVAEQAGQVTGFVVGAVDVQGHRDDVLRQHGARLAATGLVALAIRPVLAIEFGRTRVRRYTRALVRTLRRGTEPSTGERQPAEANRTAVLTHVAVDAISAGRGTGTALVRSFVNAVRQRGADRIELVTLAGPDGAGEFYRRLGWQEIDESAAGGSTFKRFVLDLR